MDMLSAGAKATDLPRDQPTSFEATIDLETAKVAGLFSNRPSSEATG
jgi:hypothetical protein